MKGVQLPERWFIKRLITNLQVRSPWRHLQTVSICVNMCQVDISVRDIVAAGQRARP